MARGLIPAGCSPLAILLGTEPVSGLTGVFFYSVLFSLSPPLLKFRQWPGRSYADTVTVLTKFTVLEHFKL